MGTNQAAREFDVPASTLKDRLSGRVTQSNKPSPSPYLSEKAGVSGFFVQVHGYGITKQEIIVILCNTFEERKVYIYFQV